MILRRGRKEGIRPENRGELPRRTENVWHARFRIAESSTCPHRQHAAQHLRLAHLHLGGAATRRRASGKRAHPAEQNRENERGVPMSVSARHDHHSRFDPESLIAEKRQNIRMGQCSDMSPDDSV